MDLVKSTQPDREGQRKQREKEMRKITENVKALIHLVNYWCLI